MMQSIRKSARGALALSLTAAGVVGAQAQATTTSPSTASKITTRQMPAAMASSTDSIGSVAAVRQLPNGNVLVNDQARRRVIMLDKNMKLVGVVADSTSSTANAYGVRPGGLMAYRGDSTLFVDPASLSMLVIDPNGKIIRTMAAPRPNDVNFLTGGAAGNPGFDGQGRLVYRTMDFGFGRGGPRPEPGKPFVPPTPPDSSALVRFDLATRKLDTAGFYKIPKANVQMTQDANGGMRVSVIMNPLPVVDDWAVLSDGTVAFVRGHDYHVDFVDASGAKTAAEKIPYDWQRMTDDDKQRFLDSSKVAIEKQRAAMVAGGGAGPGRGGLADAAAAVLGGAAPERMTITMSRPAGGEGPPRVEMGGGPGGPGGGPQPVQMVNASELPDYKPVFGTGSVKADMDGRLWVRTIPTKATTGGAIYDVIDRSGKLVDRVQVPAGTTIAGFGAGGVVYLGARDSSGLHIQRIALR
ncbi:MAG: hypothetical protein JWL61_2755 [Gemmatimonadetes bacterium]|nr:hypothetical protein [Gemmatimonadota bacterium]